VAPNAVYLVVACHNAVRRRLLNAYFKALEIDFAKSPFGHYVVGVIAVIFLIVAGKVLRTRRNAVFLYAPDRCRSGFAREIRVLGIVFEVSAAQHVPVYIHPRCQQHVAALFYHLFAHFRE